MQRSFSSSKSSFLQTSIKTVILNFTAFPSPCQGFATKFEGRNLFHGDRKNDLGGLGIAEIQNDGKAVGAGKTIVRIVVKGSVSVEAQVAVGGRDGNRCLESRIGGNLRTAYDDAVAAGELRLPDGVVGRDPWSRTLRGRRRGRRTGTTCSRRAYSRIPHQPPGIPCSAVPRRGC